LRPNVKNWQAIAPLLWQRARREAETLVGEEMVRVLRELEPLQDVAMLQCPLDATLVPVMPIELEMGGMRLSFFTVVSTFGTAQDVTADELRIESFFPADDATDQFFRAQPAE
jgi:MmyB-like transcription regulator ligand binding domain